MKVVQKLPVKQQLRQKASLQSNRNNCKKLENIELILCSKDTNSSELKGAEKAKFRKKIQMIFKVILAHQLITWSN